MNTLRILLYAVILVAAASILHSNPQSQTPTIDLRLTYDDATDTVVATWFQEHPEVLHYIVAAYDAAGNVVVTLPASAGTTMVPISPTSSRGIIAVQVTGYTPTGVIAEQTPLEPILSGSDDSSAIPHIDGPAFAASSTGIDITSITTDSRNFPFIYLTLKVNKDGVPTPDLSDTSFAVTENGVPQTNYFGVTAPYQGNAVRMADIVFIIDTSGSMSDEIADVRNNTIDFANALEVTGIDYRLGLVQFGNGSGPNPAVIGGGLTASASTFAGWISGLYASGGFEPGFEAIRLAIQSLNFRPGAQKIFILITDEDSDDRDKQATIDLILANAVTVHTAALCTEGTSSSDYCGPNSVREISGGLQFSVHGPYSDVLDTIAAVAANTYILRYRSSDPYLNGLMRTVVCSVTDGISSDSATTNYFPGGAPNIQRSAATIGLDNTPIIAGSSPTISATVTDIVEPLVKSVTLHAKPTDSTQYTIISMTRQGDEYTATIPGSLVREPGIDYYIRASDGQVNSSSPRTDPELSPHQIAVLPNKAPQVLTLAPGWILSGQPAKVWVGGYDQTNTVQSISVYYRKIGDLLYTSQSMTDGSTSRLAKEFEIPSTFSNGSGIEYYAVATDNFGVSGYKGKPDSPEVIVAGTITTSGFTFGVDDYQFRNPANREIDTLLALVELKVEELFDPIPDYFQRSLLSLAWSTISGWNGYCYGMAETSGAYFWIKGTKPFPGSTYSYTFEDAFPYIVTAQSSQAVPILWQSLAIWLDRPDHFDNWTRAQESVSQGIPVMVSLRKAGENGGHVVLGWATLKSADERCILVYDSNHEDDASKLIRLRPSGGGALVLEPYEGWYDELYVYNPWVTLSSLDFLRLGRDLLFQEFLELVDERLSQFTLMCPADAIIVDPEGRAIGNRNGVEVNEIPGASIISNGEVEIYRLPANGDYMFEVIATDSGEITIDLSLTLPSGAIRRIGFQKIVATPQTVITGSISRESVTAQIDLDGDGVADSLPVLDYDKEIAIYDILDAAPPTIASLNASPNPVTVERPVRLELLAVDTESNLAMAEFSTDHGLTWRRMEPLGEIGRTGTYAAEVPISSVPGIFEIWVRAADAMGNTSNPEKAEIVVVDPDGGFISGGGWIDSPRGSYPADMMRVGKLNFGLTANYNKGVIAPAGSLNVHFQSADLAFRSNTYKWLVVTGNKAMLKGTGLVNGKEGFDFTAWVVDGNTDSLKDPDRFRIRISRRDSSGNDVIVYDNAGGSDWETNVATVIKNGSVVIHR